MQWSNGFTPSSVRGLYCPPGMPPRTGRRLSAKGAERQGSSAVGQQVNINTVSSEAPEVQGIAEVCFRYQVSPRALRFYEAKGLLTPQRLNGTRVYSRDDRARLSRLLRAKSLGMSLAEIKHYLDMYGQHGEGRIQQLAYTVARTDEAIAELEAKRSEIDATLAELRAINDESRAILARKRGQA